MHHFKAPCHPRNHQKPATHNTKTQIMHLYDVIIAGAGPVGLFLASELALANLSVLIIEKDAQPSSPWKVDPLGLRSLNSISLEAFYRRGLLQQLVDVGERPHEPPKTGFQFAGVFAGIVLDATKFELSRLKYRLPGPTVIPLGTTLDKVEAVLTQRAEKLGVTILRGCPVEDVTQDDTSVVVDAGGSSYRGRWLVGCDGGRSAVRKAAGFEFRGTEAQFTGYVCSVELENAHDLKPGFQLTKTGLYILRKDNAVYLVDFDNGAFDRKQQPTLEHVQNVIHHVSGNTDVRITKLHQVSTFSDRCKQATTYRINRILLAGDAAHIHPPLGAQGFNLSIGDAMNLGWKLAATVKREIHHGAVDVSLLDTYESERKPIADWVMEWNRAQIMTMKPDVYGTALQSVMKEVIATRDGANLFIARTWGLMQRCDLGKGHDVLGCSVPDFVFGDGSRMGDKLEEGKGLLVDFGGDAVLEEMVERYDGVEYLGLRAKDTCSLGALLVRPDGIVAWAVDESGEADLVALKEALAKWFWC